MNHITRLLLHYAGEPLPSAKNYTNIPVKKMTNQNNTIFFRIDYSAGLSGYALAVIGNCQLRASSNRCWGLIYRGTYDQSGNSVLSKVFLSIPGGAQLVTGIANQTMSFNV